MRTTASWMCMIFVLVALGACGAVPEIALKEGLIGDWSDFVAGRRSVESLVVPQFGTAPALRSGDNAVVLPVNFSGTAFERACWDLPVKIDMGRTRGVAFDFFCADLSCFSGFSLYLRADGRWLQAQFCPDQEGQWCGIRVLKSAFKEDDPLSKVRGCLHVDRIRISGWRMKDVDTRCALANVAVIPVEPDVLVIHGVSSVGERENAADFIRFAENVEKTLSKLDIACVGVGDRELSRDLLRVLRAAGSLTPPLRRGTAP